MTSGSQLVASYLARFPHDDTDFMLDAFPFERDNHPLQETAILIYLTHPGGNAIWIVNFNLI